METCQTCTESSSDDANKSVGYLKEYLEAILRLWAKADVPWNGPKRQAILHELFGGARSVELI
jgi:hypothetical protein